MQNSKTKQAWFGIRAGCMEKKSKIQLTGGGDGAISSARSLNGYNIFLQEWRVGALSVTGRSENVGVPNPIVYISTHFDAWYD